MFENFYIMHMFLEHLLSTRIGLEPMQRLQIVLVCSLHDYSSSVFVVVKVERYLKYIYQRFCFGAPIL